MAYQDDEQPEKPAAGWGMLFVFGIATAVVTCTALLIVGLTDIGWQWLLIPSLIVVVALSACMWLSMRRRKALHLDDEFHKMRFRWSRTYGLVAAMFIVVPVYLGLQYEKYLPEDWQRVVTAVAPHPEDFVHGMMFVIWTILLCSLVADGIWQLRHK